MLCLLLLSGCREAPTAETPAPPPPSLTPTATPTYTPELAPPSPTPEPTPPPTPDPIPDGPFAALLAGDTSPILDLEVRGHIDWMFSNVTSSAFNPMFEISSLWSYTLLDLDGDGTDELFLRPRDAWYSHFIFKAEIDGLRLMEQKSVGMYYWVDPLADGRLMQTLHYDGMYTYTIYYLGSQETDVWSYRYEDRLHYVGEEPESPAWEHNGQAITEEEFDQHLQQISDLLVTDWRIAAIPDTISATAGVYEPLLRGDFSHLSDSDKDYIQLVFSVNFDWEYTLIDLDGDGAEELCMRVAGIPAISRIFHEEDGLFTCWYLQDDPSHVFEPLSDGSVLDTELRKDWATYTMYAFGTDPQYPGRRQEVTAWTYIENEDGNGPAWYHGSPSLGMPVTQKEFEDFLHSCEEKKVPYWNTVHGTFSF